MKLLVRAGIDCRNDTVLMTLPSWVPNWADRDSGSIADLEFIPLVPTSRTEIQVNHDSLELRVSGTSIDVLDKFGSIWKCDDGGNLLASLPSWELELRDFAQENHFYSDEYWEVFEGFLGKV